MHSEFFDCSICYSRFNPTDRLPKILPDCGHTICSSCLKQMLQPQRAFCPLDRKPLDKDLTNIDLVPTNMLILQMLDDKAQEKVCTVHKEPLGLYCVVDKREICEKCASEGAHRGHYVENKSEIFSKAAAKKNILKGILDEFEEEVKNLQALLEENKKNTLATMKEKFAKLYDVMYKKEQQIASEIEDFFDLEKIRVGTKIHNDISLRKLIRSKIANLNQVEINDCLIKELEDDVSILDFQASDQYSQVFLCSKEIQKYIETAFHDLFCLAGYAIEEFKPLPEIVMDYQDQQGLFKARKLRIEIESEWLMIYPMSSEENPRRVERNNVLNISKCRGLSKVCLDFRTHKLNKEMIESLGSLWKELENFTCVKLLLSNQDFNNEDLVDLCAKNFWCDKQVQSLYIYLINTKIGESGVKRLSQVIEGDNLKKLTLDFSSSTITDNCLKEVSKNLIGKLQKIEVFDLRMTSTNVSEVGMGMVYLELGKVAVHLETLNLYLELTKIGEKGFDRLNKSLLPYARNLVNLEIRFPKYENPLVNYLKPILESLWKYSWNLKQLGLTCFKPGLSEATKKFVEGWKTHDPRMILTFK